MENVIKKLEKMEESGVKTLKIYYAEDIDEWSVEWSVDVMQDELNNLCNMGWTWTVMSFKEFKCNFYDSNELIYVCNDWEIIIDRLFSEKIICEAINVWLDNYGIDIEVEMIDLKDAEGSGYVKDLKERVGNLSDRN